MKIQAVESRGMSKSLQSKGGSETKTSRIINPVVHLSGCAADYARACVNPFTGPIACIPDYPVLMSRRLRVFSRGTLATSSTTGVGFICCTPSFASASDSNCVFFTGPTYAGSTINPNTGVTGVFAATSNSDYSTSGIGTAAAQAQYRVVASGIRIRYRGSTFDQGGQIYALCEPTHDNLSTATVSDLSAQEFMRKLSVTREWANVLYSPQNTGDIGFQSTNTGGPTVADQTALGRANYMAMMIVAASPTTSLTFEWEMYTILEFTGKNVRGSVPSHFDPVGFSAVHAATTTSNHKLPFQGEAQKKESSFLETVFGYVKDAVTWVGENAGTIMSIGSAVASML